MDITDFGSCPPQSSTRQNKIHQISKEFKPEKTFKKFRSTDINLEAKDTISGVYMAFPR